jgi:beta-ureidopropionase / N-carbamoyl-L-amino-acid hydrolase
MQRFRRGVLAHASCLMPPLIQHREELGRIGDPAPLARTDTLADDAGMTLPTNLPTNLRIAGDRLLWRLATLARIGDTGDGGCRRLALSDEDRQGRDLLVSWMGELGLEIRVDRIGNILGIMAGETDGPAVMLGSHIDTVATGGRYDGALGVLAGLEVVAALKEAGIRPKRPLAVLAFTNEEGARFQPDMMGSCVWTGALSLDQAYATRGGEGLAAGEELRRIGYAGESEPGFLAAHAYLELHIEQGPVLDAEGGRIGAVTGVQAITWLEIALDGEANHAGTTPMGYRRDAGYAAARIIAYARDLTREIENQVANAGRIAFEPGNVNVVPRSAVFTMDIRNPDDARLAEAERRLRTFAETLAQEEKLGLEIRDLARFPAVGFDERLVASIENAARTLALPVRRMVSGAGHDAQLMARIAPSAMIFVPSVNGLSHNPAEYTAPDDLIAGANILLAAALAAADG